MLFYPEMISTKVRTDLVVTNYLPYLPTLPIFSTYDKMKISDIGFKLCMDYFYWLILSADLELSLHKSSLRAEFYDRIKKLQQSDILMHDSIWGSIHQFIIPIANKMFA